MTFEDVTALEGARRRLLAARRRAAGDARRRRRRDHRPVARPQADLRQRGRDALLRHPARRGAWTPSTPRTYLRRFEATDELGRPLDLARLPGRLALAGLEPEPVTIRSRELADRRGPLGADQGHRRPRPRRRRAAGDQRDRGHHRAQALRGGAALPGRGVAAARGSSLDYERTLAAVAELAVPALADRVRSSTWSTPTTAASRRRQEVMRTGAAWLEPARMIVPMTARARDRHADAVGDRRARLDAADVLVAEDFGSARGRGGRERAALSRGLADRAGAADLAAAAAPARRPGRGSWRRRSTPPARARGRRRLLRRLHHRRGPVVPGHRRRLRARAPRPRR